MKSGLSQHGHARSPKARRASASARGRAPNGNPDEDFDLKKVGLVVGIFSGIVGILVGVKALTGVNFLAIGRPGPPPSAQSPAFVVQGRPQWEDQCAYTDVCSVSAIFHNSGGTGGATAIFYVMAAKGNTGYLAQCVTPIPVTQASSSVAVGCTAFGGNLRNYLDIAVTIHVTVSDGYIAPG